MEKGKIGCEPGLGRGRLWFLTLSFLLAAGGIGWSLWQVQGVQGEDYARKAQRSIAQVETVPAARGRLLDRKGRVLAQDRLTWQLEEGEPLPPESRKALQALCREAGLSWDGKTPLENVPQEVRVKGGGLPGVTFTPVPVRQTGGTLAPHLLGRVGPMSEEEWQRYERLGYAMNEQVGKAGAEKAFQARLRGAPGKRLLYRDREGNLTGETWLTQPQPGKDVALTLDLAIQEAAQTAMEEFFAQNPQATGGAAVVLDVAEGGVLAMVSLPGYDANTFSQCYADLSADPAHPLMNRAIQGLYAPGSTFKLVTAAAALEEGVVTPETQLVDTGVYTYYRTPQPQCWLYRQKGETHGAVTLSQALADSCNLFFYDVGRRVGIETIDRYARALGLGELTGIELAGEAAGVVAGPAYTASVGERWYEGNVLSAAIGQENNRFTPLQLARMTAALVGGGVLRQVHLLGQGEGEAPYVSPVLGRLSLEEETLQAIKAGMLAATQTGSLAPAFQELPLLAGAKTGSVQVAGEETSNAVLVCFAPYEAPQVAIALVAERGGSGWELGPPAAAILRAVWEEFL